MMIAHAIVSSNFFLLVDSVTRRFKTRLYSEIFGLFYITPNLYILILIFLVVFLGFPGSLLFLSEFIFFSTILDINFFLFLCIFFFSYLYAPSSFFKSWFLLLFGSNQTTFISQKQTTTAYDLNIIELAMFIVSLVLLFWLSMTFQFFI